MKNISKKNKIILLLLILLIISGIIVLTTLGFEKSVAYKEGTKIEVLIPQGYEKQDIINIANESFNGKEFAFEEVEKLNQVASVKLEDYTEEELKNFKAKISEKYNIEDENLEIYEITVPKTKISTDISPYMFPVILTTVLSLVYVLLRNFKNRNKWKILLKILIVLAFALATYFSLILILRLPYGIYTMPVALAIYLITLMIIVNNIKK